MWPVLKKVALLLSIFKTTTTTDPASCSKARKRPSTARKVFRRLKRVFRREYRRDFTREPLMPFTCGKIWTGSEVSLLRNHPRGTKILDNEHDNAEMEDDVFFSESFEEELRRTGRHPPDAYYMPCPRQDLIREEAGVITMKRMMYVKIPIDAPDFTLRPRRRRRLHAYRNTSENEIDETTEATLNYFRLFKLRDCWQNYLQLDTISIPPWFFEELEGDQSYEVSASGEHVLWRQSPRPTIFLSDPNLHRYSQDISSFNRAQCTSRKPIRRSSGYSQLQSQSVYRVNSSVKKTGSN